MRKFAGATTPCQSKAAVMRFTRSPLAAKKLATTRMMVSARNAIGSRRLSFGCGQPALSFCAGQQGAFDMRAPQRLRHRILLIGSQFVGNRGRRPVRRVRCRGRAGAGRHNRSAPATASAGSPRSTMTIRKRTRPMARGNGGNAIHRPAHDSARKSPIAVASVASAGHSRSHSKLPRARLTARASASRAGCGRS